MLARASRVFNDLRSLLNFQDQIIQRLRVAHEVLKTNQANALKAEHKRQVALRAETDKLNTAIFKIARETGFKSEDWPGFTLGDRLTAFLEEKLKTKENKK